MSCESSGSWRKRIKTRYKDGRFLLKKMSEDKERERLVREEIEWEKRINEALATCGKELDEKLALMKKPRSKKRPRGT